jgi:hypothetical protein
MRCLPEALAGRVYFEPEGRPGGGQ